MSTFYIDMLSILPIEKRETVEKALALVLSELRYSDKWDDIRPPESLPDADKPVECWLTWMQHYLTKAISESTHSVDKTAALESIRKIAGLATTCMMYNDTPMRPTMEKPRLH